MERKQCSLCGKWTITDHIVMTNLGKYYCSKCYHEHKTILEYPYMNTDCKECWDCKKIDECIKKQIEVVSC